MMTNRLLWMLVGVPLIGVGCSSTEQVQAPKYPFHVALIPIEVESSKGFSLNSSEQDLDSIDGQLTLARDPLTEAVRRRLEDECFSKVTILPRPVPEDEVDSARFYAEQAIEMNADLVVECAVKFRPELKTAKNEKFWLNLPLFFLGGPFNYWIDDRDYYVGVDLTANVYDQSLFYDPKQPERTELDWDDRLTDALFPVERVALDFTDRVDASDVGYIALSLIAPANWLARDTDAAHQTIAVKVTDELSDRLVKEFKTDRRFMRPSLIPFRIDQETCEIEVRNDQVRFRGDVLLSRRSGISNLSAYGLGDQPPREFPEGRREADQTTRYTIDEWIPRPGPTLKLHVQANESLWRTFTFEIPNPDDGK